MNKQPDSTIYLGCRNTRARVILWDDQIVRVTHINKNAERFPLDRPWLKDVLFKPSNDQSSSDCWRIGCTEGSVEIQNDGEEINFSEYEPVKINENGEYQISIKLEPDEKIYGWGEWFNSFS